MNQNQRNRQSPNMGEGRRPLTDEEKRILLAKRAKAREAAKKKEAQVKKKMQKQAAKRRRAEILAAQREEEKKIRAEERMRRHDERFELTDEERAIREQMRREERQYRQRRRTRKARIYFGRFFLFICMFVLVLALSIGLFYANLVAYERSARRDFTYVVGEKKTSYSYESMVRNGSLYVNMTPIVSLCDMAVTGDTTELRYISRDAKENVQFTVGSTQVFINGVEERLTAAPYLIGEDLYVPYHFFGSYVSGISVDYDTQKQTVTVSKTLVPETTDTYENLRFVIRSDAPMLALDEYNEFGNTSPVEFAADLSLYEEYMNPANRDDYLILVNADNPLPQGYSPSTVEISDIRFDGRPVQYLNSVAEKAAHAMIMELATNGFEGVNILLGYRSYGKQNNLFNSTVRDYMKTMTEERAIATTLSAGIQQAGCNPQQAGLSIVMHNQEETTAAFARDPAYAWLEENCWKFGYIIRYPADKTAETGMPFQPYFFTFVGRYHAMRIMEQGVSMEEYITSLEEKNYFGSKTYAEFREELIGA